MTFQSDLKTSKRGRQYQFDEMISDTDISGLTYLGSLYDNRLKEYKMTHDLNNPDYFNEYQSLQERRKMISEELKTRNDLLDMNVLYTKDIHFNDNYDIVYRDDNGEIKLYRPSLTENGSIEIIDIDEEDVRE